MILNALLALAALMTAPADAPVPAPFELTVMTFNLRYGLAPDGENAWSKRRELLVETIRQADPDILGVQECLGFQAEYIEKELKGYRWIGVGRERGGGGEMSAIFFKQHDIVPINTGTFWLSESPEVPGSKSWDSSLPRIVTWAKCYHPKSNIFFYHFNTHFDHVGETARQESAKLLLAHVREVDQATPIIITGDYNSYAEDSVAYTTLTGGGLFDAWKSAAERKGPVTTWSAFKAPDPDSKGRIDWILFRGPLDCLSAETFTYNQDGRYPSDHYPVVAKFSQEH